MEIPHELSPALKNYGRFKNVRAVSYGAKYSDGIRIDGVAAIQFFVEAKLPVSDLKRPLPEYVFQRSATGELDRKVRIATDVIELNNLRLCCSSGDEIVAVGHQGTLTMVFRNKAGDDSVFALTCAHVVGDLLSSPASVGKSFRAGTAACSFSSTVVANTVRNGDALEFDIALLKCGDLPGEFQELSVANPPQHFKSFVSFGDLQIGDVLSALSKSTGLQDVQLDSAPAMHDGVADGIGGVLSINNLIVCRGEAREGDSGGLVSLGEQAFGIIVATTDNGWLLVHELASALSFLQSEIGTTIAVFDK